MILTASVRCTLHFHLAAAAPPPRRPPTTSTPCSAARYIPYGGPLVLSATGLTFRLRVYRIALGSRPRRSDAGREPPRRRRRSPADGRAAILTSAPRASAPSRRARGDAHGGLPRSEPWSRLGDRKTGVLREEVLIESVRSDANAGHALHGIPLAAGRTRQTRTLRISLRRGVGNHDVVKSRRRGRPAADREAGSGSRVCCCCGREASGSQRDARGCPGVRGARRAGWRHDDRLAGLGARDRRSPCCSRDSADRLVRGCGPAPGVLDGDRGQSRQGTSARVPLLRAVPFRADRLADACAQRRFRHSQVRWCWRSAGVIRARRRSSG